MSNQFNWIDKVINQHKEFETPLVFWKWASLVTISAVVKDQVWLPRAGYYNLYPNIYCILYADSGMKKGPPTNLAKKLVQGINNTKIISGRSSIQGIMKKLGTAETGRDGKIKGAKAHGFICSSELSASIVSDPAALDLLTDLFDRNYNSDDWDSLLKMEEFKLRDPTLTLFGGINDAHAEGFFEKKDISGGFLARSFVVHGKDEVRDNSLSKRPEILPNKEELLGYLRELSKLQGPFEEFSDEQNNLTEVGAYYDNWYLNFRKTIREQKVKDETGTLNRFGDAVLKVAILLSLAKSPTLKIDLDSLIEAIDLCEKCLGGVRHAVHGKKGLSGSAQLKELIIRELLLRDNHTATRQILMRKFCYHYSTAEEFNDLMSSFEDAGLIKATSNGYTMSYTMVEEQVQRLKKYFEGKGVNYE